LENIREKALKAYEALFSNQVPPMTVDQFFALIQNLTPSLSRALLLSKGQVTPFLSA